MTEIMIKQNLPTFTSITHIKTSPTPQNSSCKEGFLVIFLSLVLALTLGLVLAYRLDWQSARACHTSWRGSPWLTTFRWVLGLFGPMGIVAMPALYRLFDMRHDINSKLKKYIVLSSEFVERLSPN